MADINFNNPQGPTNPNQASLLGRNLRDAIGVVSDEGQRVFNSVSDFKDNPVGAAKTAADTISTGIGAVDILGLANVNPAVMGAKAVYDIATFPGRYSDQSKEDFAKYGNQKTAGGTLFRSLPLIGGIASAFGPGTTRPDLSLDMRTYLAERGVNINDWEGGNELFDKINSVPFNPASTPVTQSNLAPIEGNSSGETSAQESYESWADSNN
tara:strand:+ start:468 stop:1100 length:633 start_codon:yes stop_codon:yes gene_type:complete